MSRLQPEVSIIVCHHKGEFIHKFVESVKRGVGVNYEIIVVTSDKALAHFGIPDCQVIEGPAMPAAKRNLGTRIAKGKYFAFFDDDVEINPDCLLQLKNSLGPSIGMVYGKLWNMDRRNRFDEAGGFLTSTGFIWSRAGQNDVDMGQYDTEEYIFSGKSASCMIKRDTFNRAGGFDEDFGILGEESDLAWRVWLIGKCVMWVPSATGLHAFNTSMKPANDYYTSDRVQFNGCRNYITMLIKNLEAKNLWKILPIHITIWIFAGLALVITGKVRQGWNILRGVAYIVSHRKQILKKRKEVQDRRVKSDDELWPILFRSPGRAYYTQRFTRYFRNPALHG